MSRSKQRDV